MPSPTSWTRTIVRTGLAVVAAGALSGAGVSLRAQSLNPESKLQIELSLMAGTLNRSLTNNAVGDSLGPAKMGFGVDGAAVVPAGSMLWVAAGFQYLSHKTDEVWTKSNLNLLTIYIEPRFVLRQTGRFTPYVWARLGYTHAAQDQSLVDETGFESIGNAVQTGPMFAGGAALQSQVSAHIRAFGSVGYQFTPLGDVDFDYDHVPSSGVKVNGLLVRAGVAFDFSLAGSGAGAFHSFFRR